MVSDLSLLICGKLDDSSPLGQVFAHVGKSIDAVLEELSWLEHQPDRRVVLYGPFLGRALLELAATALSGRLDPLRLLIVHYVQQSSGYDIAKVWKVSMRWQGDVMAPLSEKEVGHSLDQLEYEKIPKALFGRHYDTLVWQPAVTRMVGYEGKVEWGNWMASMATQDAASFIPRRREVIGKLYSSFSKGIHHEFVTSPEEKLDRPTVVSLVSEAVQAIAELAIASHFIGHTTASIPRDEAIACFNRVEQLEVIK